MSKNAKSITIFIISLCILLPISSSLAHAQEASLKRVLVLNSYQKGFPWTDDIVKGIESVFKSGENNPELTVEYMDTKTIGYETEYKEQLYDLYKYKYKKHKIDLIISSDDNALNFLREYHEDLFPDVSIVFCGVNNLDVSNIIDREVFTGLVELHSIKETIDIALRLHPGTKQIVFVVDNSPTGTYLWNQIQGLFEYYEDTRMIRIDNSLSMEQIEDKVSRLPDDTVVYWGTLHSDKYGKYYSFGEGALRVSKASSRPMYGHSVEILPYGIVGGKLLGGFYNGQVAAEMAQRILMGEKVRDIPVLTESQTQYMFNNEQMQRFGIGISALPKESIVINKPHSFYKENKVLIWCAITVIIFQMLIIISLIINSTKRRKAEESLQESERENKNLYSMVRLMCDNLPELIWTKDLQGRFMFVNKACCEDLLNAGDTDEPVGKTDIYFTDREKQSHIENPNYHTFGESCTDSDKSVLEYLEVKRTEESGNIKGEFVVLDVVKAPFWDENGKLIGTVGCARDVTREKEIEIERKKAEEELRKHREHLEEMVDERTAEIEKRISEVEKLNRAMVNLMGDLRVSNEKLEMSTQQLDNANKELEAFAYSVSHDLRAPLRGIDGFSQVLLEDYANKLDEDGKHYLERVRTGTQRMGRLIDDILQLSRDGRRKMKPESVDLSEMTRKISKEFEQSEPERKVKFIIKDGLIVNGDAHLLQIVFNNLLENALKFTSRQSEARIEFGMTEKEGKRVFYVRDNGAGFNMAYVEKIFVPFQRLHSEREFTGTGIGLANVQRIIRRHSGSIWAEGEEGKGATFYFTI